MRQSLHEEFPTAYPEAGLCSPNGEMDRSMVEEP